MGLRPEPLELRTLQQTEGRGRRGPWGLHRLSQASTPEPGLLGGAAQWADFLHPRASLETQGNGPNHLGLSSKQEMLK